MNFHVRYAKITTMRKLGKTIGKILIGATFVLTLSACGKKSTVYYDAGMAYLEKGNSSDAAINFTLSLQNEGETKQALRGLGIANVMEGQYDDAITVFLRALSKSNGRIDASDYDINYYLGYAYEKSGQFEEAVDTYSAIILMRPKETDAYYHRAICYLKMGEASLADEDFAKVTLKNADDYDTHIRIFFAIKDAGFETEAKSYLTAILEDGERKISDYDRGRMDYYLENYSDARVFLEKAKDMSNADTVLMLGKTYEAIGDYSYAASLYSNYLDQKGNNAAVYNQLGVCRWKLEDYEGALVAFSFGLKLEDPEWQKELMYNEAVTYEYLLDFENAREKMSAYLSEYPKDENAAHELLFLETR